ncbi:MAG: helix-hairpin-helix domain-containing protein [Clostridia bacterium]|nr:helix-hairpin-helix domain-containing protein [Clostridia bacterium]
MDNSNIFNNNSTKITHEKMLIKILISLTILMAAGVIIYNAFFKKEISGVDFISENKKISTKAETKPKKSQKINLNTASKEELVTNISGIGEKTANKIINYRKTNGGFTSKEELMNIKGIGKNKFEKIKYKITV